MTNLQPFIDVALQLADSARAEIMGHFRTDILIDAKPDASPVTEADRAAERAMRDIIAATCPDHGILGEEFGSENVDAEYVWVLDPIDGTNSFVTGKPLFGTLIALCQNGVPVIGVIDAPALDERWVGARGRATTFNGAPASVRGCSALDQAWLYATTPDMFTGDDASAFQALSKAARRTVYGGDCYAYGLLASGHVDVVCEASLGTYDYAALVNVVTAAGGIITDWQGAPLTLRSDGRVLAAGDRAVHAAALKVLAANWGADNRGVDKDAQS